MLAKVADFQSIIDHMVGDADTLRYLEQTNCDLQTIGDDFGKKPYGLAVQKDSKLKYILDDA